MRAGHLGENRLWLALFLHLYLYRQDAAGENLNGNKELANKTAARREAALKVSPTGKQNSLPAIAMPRRRWRKKAQIATFAAAFL